LVVAPVPVLALVPVQELVQELVLVQEMVQEMVQELVQVLVQVLVPHRREEASLQPTIKPAT